VNCPTTCNARSRLLGTTIALLLAALPPLGQAKLEFHWQDRFSPAEQAQLIAWVEETQGALERLVGPFRFDVHVHFHRRDGAREPVPWANTQRHRRQGVNFHVDPSFPPHAFFEDWTAAHELSHLILPYLGPRHAWFAEGFASFMQYRVMQAMNVLTPLEAAQRYRQNLERAERSYHFPDTPFIDAAPRLRAERNYSTLYWGGAAYFLQVDARLRESGAGDVLDALRRYLDCCRRDRADLAGLMAELDRAAGEAAFSKQMAEFRLRRGFPRWREMVAAP
jgi:hypothetical protein